ncbi:MAG: thiol-disulfide isomerase/thioredoxin [Bradymonadia bacterium]|jgi:thiol-disulfide isomerase/thioredoxin
MRSVPFCVMALASLLLAGLQLGCLEEGAAAKNNPAVGGEGGAGGEGGMLGEGGAGGEVGDRGPYPTEGLGKAEGKTLENLSFPVRGGRLSLADIYGDASNKIMLVSTSAGWCSACIEEQPKLAALHEQYAERGLYVLVTLFETADFQPADLRLATMWKGRYDLPFTVVADPEFQFQDYYDRDATPMTMLVDVETMLILKIATGFNETEVRAIIEAVL